MALTFCSLRQFLPPQKPETFSRAPLFSLPAVARYENIARRVPLSTARARIRAREKNLAVALARELKALREKRKLSIEALAKKTGLTPDRIRNFESAARSPYLEEFFRLAQAFRMRPWRLARRYAEAASRVRPARVPQAAQS